MKTYCKNCIYQTLPVTKNSYPANQLVFLEGDPLDVVYRIEEGYVKMHRYLESGDERIIGILGPGDYIALLAVLQEEQNYIASAMTLTDTVLQAIQRNDVETAYNSNAMFKDHCIQCAITRTQFFQFQFTQSANPDVEDKILNTLNNLFKKFGDPFSQPRHLELPFSKTVLANIIGIRRETLSRHLSAMQAKRMLMVEKNQYILY